VSEKNKLTLTKREILKKLDEFIKSTKDENEVNFKNFAKYLGTYPQYLRYYLNNLGIKNEVIRKINNYKVLNSDKVDIIEKLELEITKLKEENKLLKKKYNKLLKELSIEDELINEFNEKIDEYLKSAQFQNKSLRALEELKEKLYKQNKNASSAEEELVLILSDWHIGEIVYPEQVNNLNIYNLDIAKERVNIVLDKFLKIAKRLETEKKYKKVNVFLLGDMISGIIHDELVENSIPISDQVIECANLLSDVIYKLSYLYENIEVYGVSGNHSRVKKTVSYKNKYSGFDYLTYKFTESLCKNIKNARFFIPKSPMIIINKFNKYNFLLRHGDGKSQSFAGIPFYGIIRQSTKVQQLFNAYKDIYIHYQIMGHFHMNVSLPYPNGQIIIAGSLKGIDEFSFNNFLASEPSQTMLAINEKVGVFARIDLLCKEF